MIAALRPAPTAFEHIASTFDARFGPWQSVAKQRRAVRSALLQAFAPGGRILEVGGGTGEDAAFLAACGFDVLLTDASPTMVSLAGRKLAQFGGRAELLAAEETEEFAARHISSGGTLFDGVFSNFAPLNCVTTLQPVARGLARLLKPDAPALLVLFGRCCPGEVVTEILRGRALQALRRFRNREVAARVAGCEFSIVYHSAQSVQSAFAPWFVLEKRLGVGITVPPSAAEPWISGHPRLLAAMERIDRVLARPLAALGDHVLYHFRRTAVEC